MSVASVADLLAAAKIGAGETQLEVSGVEYEYVEQYQYNGGDRTWRNKAREPVRFLAFTSAGVVVQRQDGVIDSIPYGWDERRTTSQTHRKGVRAVPDDPNA